MWMLLTGLALALLIVNLWRGNLLIAVADFLLWIGLAVYMFLDAGAIFGIGQTYYIFFVYVYIILAVGSLLSLMDYQITKEKDGNKWTEWGGRPKDKETNLDKYRKELYGRTRRGR
ncbi:hypothetical protein LCGC14_0971060 [marine sediment metagenome]|uniref:Uncharacterized protein n=1 Tax=marine sediment metagenome TaxID=412755 RepID=A0A0F9QUT2_9ZZZZ